MGSIPLAITRLEGKIVVRIRVVNQQTIVMFCGDAVAERATDLSGNLVMVGRGQAFHIDILAGVDPGKAITRHIVAITICGSGIIGDMSPAKGFVCARSIGDPVLAVAGIIHRDGIHHDFGMERHFEVIGFGFVA